MVATCTRGDPRAVLTGLVVIKQVGNLVVPMGLPFLVAHEYSVQQCILHSTQDPYARHTFRGPLNRDPKPSTLILDPQSKPQS